MRHGRQAKLIQVQPTAALDRCQGWTDPSCRPRRQRQHRPVCDERQMNVRDKYLSAVLLSASLLVTLLLLAFGVWLLSVSSFGYEYRTALVEIPRPCVTLPHCPYGPPTKLAECDEIITDPFSAILRSDRLLGCLA